MARTTFDRLADVCQRRLSLIRLDAWRKIKRAVSHPNGIRLDDLADIALDLHLLIVAHGGQPGILVELAAQRRLHDPDALRGPDLTVRECGEIERLRLIHTFTNALRAYSPDLAPAHPSFADHHAKCLFHHDLADTPCISSDGNTILDGAAPTTGPNPF